MVRDRNNDLLEEERELLLFNYMMSNDHKKEVNLKELISVKDNSFLVMDNLSFVKDKDKDPQRSLLLNSLLDVNTSNNGIYSNVYNNNNNNNVSMQREFN